MRALIRAGVIVLVITVVITASLFAAAGSLRWAKRQSPATQLLASAMMLVMGFYQPVVHPPQQGIEEAREDKGSKGSEDSGDPPAA